MPQWLIAILVPLRAFSLPLSCGNQNGLWSSFCSDESKHQMFSDQPTKFLVSKLDFLRAYSLLGSTSGAALPGRVQSSV